MKGVRKRRFTGALVVAGGGGRGPRWARLAPAARLAAAAGLAGLLVSVPAAAQGRAPPPPSWVGDAAALGVNGLLGGLTAGLVQEARGGSFQDGFTRGFAGGIVVYGGKRVAVQQFGGAGLVGRQLSAVGSSVIRNASDGRPSLERLVLPVGPVRLYLSQRHGEPFARARLDLATVVAAGYAVRAPELEWDPRESLSSGALVFRAENLLLRGEGDAEIGASGITRAGAIYASDIIALDFAEDVQHERVHVIQFDQFFLTGTDHAEDWLLHRLPGGGIAARYVDLNLSNLVTTGLAEAFKNYYQRPWELEARYLSQR